MLHARHHHMAELLQHHKSYNTEGMAEQPVRKVPTTTNTSSGDPMLQRCMTGGSAQQDAPQTVCWLVHAVLTFPPLGPHGRRHKLGNIKI